MYPDFFIYDELKKRRERDAWEPEPLHLPLYEPYQGSDLHDDDEDDSAPGKRRGVTIIDMNDYTEVEQSEYPLA